VSAEGGFGGRDFGGVCIFAIGEEGKSLLLLVVSVEGSCGGRDFGGVCIFATGGRGKSLLLLVGEVGFCWLVVGGCLSLGIKGIIISNGYN